MSHMVCGWLTLSGSKNVLGSNPKLCMFPSYVWVCVQILWFHPTVQKHPCLGCIPWTCIGEFLIFSHNILGHVKLLLYCFDVHPAVFN